MRHLNRIVKWIMPIFFCVLAIGIYIYTDSLTKKNIEGNELFILVNNLTDGYKVKEIVAAVLMFVAGYILAQCIFEKQNDIIKAIWAIPISIVVWCTCSVLVLFIRIPYTKCIMSGIILILFTLIVCFKRKSVRKINFRLLCRFSIWSLGLSIIFSTGIVPTVMSSDSYYYVMQYGEIIAKTGNLSFDTAGATMTWTGISAALLSSLACFCGFETIIVIHNLLIVSFIACFLVSIRRQIMKLGLKNKKATMFAILITIMLIVMPAFELLAFWVISNTYCMVYIFFLMIGLELYITQERQNIILLIFLSMIVVWLTLSRAEMCVCMACMVCIVSILPMNKKELLILSIPMAVLQIVYLLELDYQQFISDKEVYDSMFTLQIQGIMLVALIGCVVYSFFINKKFFPYIRDRIVILLFIGSPILYAIIYFIDRQKFITSIKSMWFNLTTQYWGIIPIMFLVLILFIISKKENNYWLVFSAGYVLVNLALCLGRKQPLRNGYGDSCNRILMSAIPIVFFALTYSFTEIALLKKNK